MTKHHTSRPDVQLHIRNHELQASNTHGKRLWKKDFPPGVLVGAEAHGVHVLVTLSFGLLCLNAETGKNLWRVTFPENRPPTRKMFYEDTVLISFWTSGAYLHCRTNAFDSATGRRLWDVEGELKQATKTTVVLERRFPVPDPTAHEEISHVTLERRTGKERKPLHAPS